MAKRKHELIGRHINVTVVNNKHVVDLDLINDEPIKGRIIKSLDQIMPFGKFTNMSFEYILNDEPGYILWLEREASDSIIISSAIVSMAQIEYDAKEEKVASTRKTIRRNMRDVRPDHDEFDHADRF